MGNIGYCTRGTRMLQIVKGSDLVSGIKQTAAYKVGDDVKIISGEPIYVVKNTSGDLEWAKSGDSAPFFAFTDSDSFDVIASGSLLGISVLDTFELQTPLFVESDDAPFQPGDKLTVGKGYIVKNGGNFDVVGTKPEDGRAIEVNCVVKATSDNDAVIGYVTEGVVQLSGNAKVDILKSGSDESAVAVDGVYLDGYVTEKKKSEILTGGPALYTEASKSKFVLQFATAWKPAVKTKGTDPEGTDPEGNA